MFKWDIRRNTRFYISFTDISFTENGGCSRSLILYPPRISTTIFFLININTRVSLSNFCSNGCVLHGFAVFRICPIPPTRALHLDYVDLFHFVRLICIYDICAFSFTFEASFNTPIQEKTGSCREARSKGPSAFAAQYLLSKKFQVNVEDDKFTVNQVIF